MSTEITITRSDGQSITLGGADWLILSINGLDAPVHTLFTEKRASGTGSVITGNSIEKRVIDIEARAASVNETVNRRLRAQAIAFFNVAYSFTVAVRFMGVMRWTNARLNSLEMPQKKTNNPVELGLSFLCPDPYLKSMDDFAQNIAAVTPCSGFPFMSPPGGLPVSIYNFTRSVAVLNTGDAPASFRAVLHARGEVVNPKLIKDGKYVRLLLTMQQGDSLTIDLEQKSITMNGSDALMYIDRASSFTAMQFEIGDNTISYDADSGNNLLDVTLYYNLNYLGM